MLSMLILATFDPVATNHRQAAMHPVLLEEKDVPTCIHLQNKLILEQAYEDSLRKAVSLSSLVAFEGHQGHVRSRGSLHCWRSESPSDPLDERLRCRDV